MGVDVMRDLKMAEISLAKVKDVDKLGEEAAEVLKDFRADLRIKTEIKEAIDNINVVADYQLTPELADQVDDLILTSPALVVKNGQVNIAGVEGFGLTITPSEWRKTRMFALKDILDETYRNIKRWANALSDNFNTRWIELTTTTKILQERLDELNGNLEHLTEIREGVTEIELNELVARSLSKSGKLIQGDLAKGIQQEVNFIFTCMKLVEMEQIRFKNSIIKYFGNENSTDITEIHRDIPKVFDVRATVVGDNADKLIARRSKPMMGGFAFEASELNKDWVKKDILGDKPTADYAEALGLTGFRTVVEDTRINKTGIKVLSMAQMFIIADTVQSIINKLNQINIEDDPVNFNPDDVKDVLKHLRAVDAADDRGMQYGLITADYQFNTNSFKTEVASKLVVTASHILTMLNHNASCYNAE